MSSTARPKVIRAGVGRLRLNASGITLAAFLLVQVVALSLLSPVFLTKVNLVNVGLALAGLGILAAATSVVMFSGGLDLSIASTVALAGTVSAMISTADGPWWVAVLAALGMGLLAGVLNGSIINYLNINPIIATIGTMSVIRGVAFILSGGQSFVLDDDRLLYFGNGRLFGLPVPILLTGLVFLTVHLWLTRTVSGRYIYAVGGNETACRLAGMPVKRIRMGVYMMVGVLSGLAGLVINGLMGVGMAYAAQGSELDAIAAVLLGGASLSGGEGTIGGTVVGLLIISVMNNGMILLNVPAYWQTVAKGAVLLIAVGLDQYRRAKAQA